MSNRGVPLNMLKVFYVLDIRDNLLLVKSWLLLGRGVVHQERSGAQEGWGNHPYRTDEGQSVREALVTAQFELNISKLIVDQGREYGSTAHKGFSSRRPSKSNPTLPTRSSRMA